MLKSSGNESNEIKKLKKESKLIAREIGVKNYKNISKSRIIK